MSRLQSMRDHVLPFVVPTLLALAIMTLVRDPTGRYPLLAMALPGFLRAASMVIGIYDHRVRRSWVRACLGTLGFTAMVFGWNLMFTIIVFSLATLAFDMEANSSLVKQSIVIGNAGFILAAWFWWPYYARQVLPDWPRHDVRLFVKANNQWTAMLHAFQMQKLATSGAARWRGFAALSAVVVTVLTLAGLGVYPHVLVRFVEAVLVITLLPLLHTVIVSDANRLCIEWARLPIKAD